MSRLRKEMRQIPRVGWWIAVLVYVGLMILIITLLARDPDGRAWPHWGKTLFAVFVPLPCVIYALLVSYINGDARRRGMRYVLWTLLAIFIPNGIGIILYFVLRDPELVPCPSCSALARSSFAFCSKCGTALGPACPQCRRSVEAGCSRSGSSSARSR